MMSLTQLFCDVDDFCETFIPQWEASQIESGEKIKSSDDFLFSDR
jgi:hypothetical protein